MKRVPIIDFVRFGSIFIVLGEHFFPGWLSQFITQPLLHKIVLNVFRNGVYGVTCFFVVSGFLITEILVEKKQDFSTVDLRSFYVRRAARILPLLIVVVLTAFCLEHFKGMLDPRVQTYHVWNDESNFSWLFWLCLATFTFNWYITQHYYVEGFQWNVIWSLAVEEQFYFFYPLILKTLKVRRKVLFFLFGVVLSSLLFRGATSFYFEPRNGFSPAFIVFNLMASFSCFDQIAIGAILYFVHEKWGDWLEGHQTLSLALMLLGFSGCCGLIYGTSTMNKNDLIYVPTLVAFSCATLLLGGLHLPLLFSKLAMVLSWPGKLSYGCYLWHPTLIFLLMPLLMALNGFGSFVYMVVCVFFFAFLSFRFFEVPVNHWVRAQFKIKPSNKI